ncbi:MAG TPA: NADP-dependent oxidoreductase [Jatrophihabitans sp.]|nr:NADP-dependent oxidoreductase [Jatrophihabitans sp.]
MTRIVAATGYGGPENLAVLQIPTPEPRSGEVRIAVRAAGVNPIDHKSYSGIFGADPANLPIRLGHEAAGVVTAVGADVEGIAPGQEVIAYPAEHAYASDLVVLSTSIVAKPAELDWPSAGGLMVVGVTAVHAIESVGVADGETVLVHGAAGGVGLMAVQLAAQRGARVIGTASPAKHELLQSFGVTPVEYGTGLRERVNAMAPDGVAAALDLIGTDEALEVSTELVADRSRITTIANFARAAEFGVNLLGGGAGADPGTAVRSAARRPLAEAVAAGKLRLLVAGTFPLADAAEAHRRQRSGHTSGKLVLVP